MVGIPMGTNCAPLLADLFLYSNENEFLYKLINPSYTKLFRTHTLYQGGGGGGGGPDDSYLINTWLYKRQILQGIRDALQCFRNYKVCKKIFYMVTMATV